MKSKLSILEQDKFLRPFEEHFVRRAKQRTKKIEQWFGGKRFAHIANSFSYFALHDEQNTQIIREWAPHAQEIYLIGDFNGWEISDQYKFISLTDGIWELQLPAKTVSHLDFYKLFIRWAGGEGERLPSRANYVVQDPATYLFCSRYWHPGNAYQFKYSVPETRAPLFIYEAHIGMATEELRVGTYNEFTNDILPHIAEMGYNAVQLMAVQEHPYYGSFGYQVSNFFAASSRFGTPDDLKRLIDTAHHLGLIVIMDIVHSHAVGNIGEGLNQLDGSDDLYFHPGEKGNHPAWGTKCFNYGQKEVVEFLLSNCFYWINEFHFDGLRFDGVTSMLYHNHGLGSHFSEYADYFSLNVDEDALDYLYFANSLLEEMEVKVRIAEDMSGMPGIAYPSQEGGIGFTHRLAMGIPDFWIKLIKEQKDEQWDMEHMWYELMNVRWNEGAISYCESHDQALVGDKTLIFRLADKDMYDHFACNLRNDVINRAIALHKLIRAITMITAKEGYLTFMGNEFGHPEWIDFPREGNNWSYQYCRRQWSLSKDHQLCFKNLMFFEQDLIRLLIDYQIFEQCFAVKVFSHNTDKILVVERNKLIFCFNFHPTQSYSDYSIYLGKAGGYFQEVFNSDLDNYSGFDRLHIGTEHLVDKAGKVKLYLPARTMLILLNN